MAKDSKEFKELSTMIIAPDGTLREANRPALIAKLQELANADTTIKRNLNETELNYTINRLIVLSFHQHKSPEALKKTVERFFRPKLTKLFEATKAVTDTTTAESFANAIIDAIDFASLDLETATSATTLESDTYALTIVGTEGIEGLRGMVNLGSEKANIVVRTGNILEKISEGQRDTYKSAMLEMSSKLPGKNETRTEAYEFLRSPLAIKLADYASILLGPKHSDSLAELYKMKSPETIAALLATEKFRQVYDTFRALVDQFRDVQITGKEYMVWKNMDGYTFVLKDLTEYGAGVHKKCANPTLLVHEEFAIARLNGRIGSVTAEAVQRAEYKSGTHIYELFAGLAVKPEEEKPVEEKGGKGPKVKGTKDKLDPGSFDRDIGEFEGGGTDQPDEGSGIFD
ncbi:MAG: hypothetical protein ACD_65C00324G0001 [uncultured bacterium]|nr:MAG: hypothetical protein ACD_65C00324G0001 [uncultured bacterium]